MKAKECFHDVVSIQQKHQSRLEIVRLLTKLIYGLQKEKRSNLANPLQWGAKSFNLAKTSSMSVSSCALQPDNVWGLGHYF